MRNRKKVYALILTAFLLGCGSGGNGSTSKTESTQLSGKVVDGYVKDAIVCGDLNKNFKCDSNEPSTISDKNGNYILETNKKDFILISIGGIDTEDNSKAPTMYSLPKYKNITPLTTLAVKEGEEKIIQTFGISSSKIGADPMKDNEIRNIIKNINSNEWQISKTPIELNNTKESNNTIEKKNETNETDKTIKKKSGNEDIPPQISGDLTPPQIGENK